MFDLEAAHWFPIDYDAARGEFLFLDVDPASIGATAFLDRERWALDWDRALRVPVAELRIDRPAHPPGLLFHTAFCGSTLLARALHAPPGVMALKEPLALLRLSHASLVSDPSRIDATLGVLLDLLGRAWSAEGRTLIKPTNQVNRLLPSILAARPVRAILLYSNLREFLISCCKKLPAAETPLRFMAQHLIQGTALQRALGIAMSHPFNFIESCVLTWYAQMERYADALAGDAHDRLRSLDMGALLAAPANAVTACARWLQLDGALAGIDARVGIEFARNAKFIDKAFDPTQREREKSLVVSNYRSLIEPALEWAQQSIAPYARIPRDFKPLLAEPEDTR